jgi:hypothetical protein
MGHQSRMAVEVEKWMARLNAYVRGGTHARPAPREAPRWLLGKIGYRVAMPCLDAAYRRHLLELTQARRAVADTATSRKRLELQIGQLEGGAGQPPQYIAEHLADLRRQHSHLRAREERVTEASRRLMAEINAFRAAEEAAKAANTAAEEAAGAVWVAKNE